MMTCLSNKVSSNLEDWICCNSAKVFEVDEKITTFNTVKKHILFTALQNVLRSPCQPGAQHHYGITSRSHQRNVSSGLCGQRRSRSACTSAQSNQGLRCPLIEVLDTIDRINREQMTG